MTQKTLNCKPIKIVFLTHYASLYGANRSLVNLIIGLKKGYNVEPLVIVPGPGDITDTLKLNRIDYFVSHFGIGVHVKFHEKFKIPFKTVKHLWELLVIYKKMKGFRPDLIHSNSSIIVIGYYLSRLLHIPHIWHVREFGKEHYHFKYDLGDKTIRRLFRNSELVIAISKSIANYRLKDIGARVKVVYNGILSKYELMTLPLKENKADKPFVFAIIGKISESKGQLQAVRAFKRVSRDIKHIRLLIIGDADDVKYEKIIRDEVTSENIRSNIEFVGYVRDVMPYYEKINVLLMCSSWEAFGRVTVEALINRIPVIGYNSCGTSEIISEGVNGLLFDDFNELSSLMVRLATDKDLYHHLCTGSTAGLEAFTIESSAKVFYDEISQIIT